MTVNWPLNIDHSGFTQPVFLLKVETNLQKPSMQVGPNPLRINSWKNTVEDTPTTTVTSSNCGITRWMYYPSVLIPRHTFSQVYPYSSPPTHTILQVQFA